MLCELAPPSPIILVVACCPRAIDRLCHARTSINDLLVNLNAERRHETLVCVTQVLQATLPLKATTEASSAVRPSSMHILGQDLFAGQPMHHAHFNCHTSHFIDCTALPRA